MDRNNRVSTADLRLRRVYYVDKSFSFTLDKYNKLLLFQKGGCAICGEKPVGTRLAVDHRHTDGLLRGLLCFRCNRAYALFHDNSWQRLLNAANYLRYPPFVKLYGERFTAKGRLGTKIRAKILKKMINE